MAIYGVDAVCIVGNNVACDSIAVYSRVSDVGNENSWRYDDAWRQTFYLSSKFFFPRVFFDVFPKMMFHVKLFVNEMKNTRHNLYINNFRVTIPIWEESARKKKHGFFFFFVSVLFWASWLRNFSSCFYALKIEIFSHLHFQEGETALHKACRKCHYPVVKELLHHAKLRGEQECQAFVCRTNREGECALHYCGKIKKSSLHFPKEDAMIMKLLMEHGSDVMAQTKEVRNKLKHTGTKTNFLSRNYPQFDVWEMLILWKMRLWKMWILWKVRFWNCELKRIENVNQV